jgi:DnaK suppressor protein
MAQAIARIDPGDYGWCEETGDPIGIARLLVTPVASLAVEAQQPREVRQRMFGS